MNNKVILYEKYVGSNMSISKHEKKARNEAKNKLNKELSLIQLLYLVKEYNLE